MKQSISAIVPLCGLAFVASVFAQETSLGGTLTTQAGVGLPNAHHNKGDFLLGQTIFDGSIKSYLDKSMIYLNGQIVHNALGSQTTNGSSAFVADDGIFALKLREAYFNWKGETFALKVGRQVESWGRAKEMSF